MTPDHDDYGIEAPSHIEREQHHPSSSCQWSKVLWCNSNYDSLVVTSYIHILLNQPHSKKLMNIPTRFLLSIVLVVASCDHLFADDARPNVVFLAVDDMNDFVGCLRV